MKTIKHSVISYAKPELQTYVTESVGLLCQSQSMTTEEVVIGEEEDWIIVIN